MIILLLIAWMASTFIAVYRYTHGQHFHAAVDFTMAVACLFLALRRVVNQGTTY